MILCSPTGIYKQFTSTFSPSQENIGYTNHERRDKTSPNSVQPPSNTDQSASRTAGNMPNVEGDHKRMDAWEETEQTKLRQKMFKGRPCVIF